MGLLKGEGRAQAHPPTKSQFIEVTLLSTIFKAEMAKLNKTLSDAVQVPPDATSNSIVYMHALFCGGALSGYTQVKLDKPWSEDFGRLGWMHPEHNNEALVFSKDRDLWVILDCCGDIYSFNDLDSALAEFNSPEGHKIWLEVGAHGQHMEDRYFALK